MTSLKVLNFVMNTATALFRFVEVSRLSTVAGLPCCTIKSKGYPYRCCDFSSTLFANQFSLLSDDQLLLKYGVSSDTQLIWHAELAGEIVPEECEMRSRGREFVLKKRDPAEWNSRLIQCNSFSASSYSSRRSYTSARSVSYVYSNSPSNADFRSSSQAPNYLRVNYVNGSRPSYSSNTYSQSASRYSSAMYSPTARSRSTSSLSSRSSISPVISSNSLSVPHAVSTGVPDDPILPSYQSLIANTVRPTAKVPPYEEQITLTEAGFTGLQNIGNTCFMNATLQMLVNCKELQVFFTGDYYKKDINPSNPLGFGGRLAKVFAEFMKQMWNGMNRTYEPAAVKKLIAEKAPQFANFAQHDAHEFLSFLLDGLHEDLNRVRKKAFTSTVEADGRPDVEVSNEAWQNHLLRNDSIFVDLFHGQLKSRLECPKCSRISVTFDPFVYLAVPFPKEKRSSSIYFWPAEPNSKPFKLTVRYNVDSTASEVLYAVGQLVKVKENLLRLVEVDDRSITKICNPNDKVNGFHSSTSVYVFQLLDPTECGESVVQICVVQRLIPHKKLVGACSNCQVTGEKLKTCDEHHDAYYNKECQTAHWDAEHRQQSKIGPQFNTIGEPFLISLPSSKTTYRTLKKNLELRCRVSVNVRQLSTDEQTKTTESYCKSDVLQDKNGNPETARNDIKIVKGALSESIEIFNGNTVTGTHSMFDEKESPSILGENEKCWDGSLFTICKLNSINSIYGEPLSASNNERIDLPEITYLSMNWHNVEFNKKCLTVESKNDLVYFYPFRNNKTVQELDAERTEYFEDDMTGNSSSVSNPTLHDMLSVFSETEKLKSEESWYCNKCKEHVEATKKLVLYRLPPILIVQLKRFVYTSSVFSMHRRSKNEKPVIYPLKNLDLSNFLCETAPEGQIAKYDLTGVVCHSGSSYYGHYISIGKLSSLDGKSTEIDWRVFDDSIVSRTEPSRVQSNDAYLLFYKQQGDVTKNLLAKRYGVSFED
uniref:Ubiquitin carboxyl-terminal hydrolase n=1 Tax=Syphacia muris TaxID=451379 RepID=A0A0N5AEL9_9BILA